MQGVPGAHAIIGLMTFAASKRASEPNYNALANRAYAFLQRTGGTALAAALARELFGPTAKGPLWTSMLARVLGADPRFRAGPGERWSLAGLGATQLPLDEVGFVVLDLESTGLKPWRQRLVEIAALRLVEGSVAGSFATLLNPGRRLPKYLGDLAGFNQEDLAEAPPFAAVADELLAFLEGAVLVGHGLTLDLGYLQAELRRLGKPPLANPVLDTLDLAGRLLPGRGKPTLDNLAALLGLSVGRRHRAANDAHLVAALFPHLLALAKADGATTLADLLPPGAAPRGRYALLDASPLRDVEEGPGVYMLKDAGGQVVYVGKAIKLRARLATYFSRPPGYTRRMEGLVEAVADFSTVPLGSELEALLAEARLIAQHQPRFNVQQATKTQPAYLRLDLNEPFPRLGACARPAADGARYWGPLRHGSAVRAALRDLNHLFPLRSCRRRLKPKRSKRAKPPVACRQLPLGNCLGPCVDSSLEEQCRALAAEVVDFLDGRRTATIRRLEGQMAEAVAAGDRPRVETLRKHLRLARLFSLQGREEELPPARASVAVVLPSVAAGRAEVFVLWEGRYGGQRRVAPWDDATTLAGVLRQMAANAVAGDEANLVARWLAANPSAPIVPLATGGEGWEEVATAVLRLVAETGSYEGDTPDADPVRSIISPEDERAAGNAGGQQTASRGEPSPSSASNHRGGVNGN